jgi:hypothetical protein
LGGSNDPGWTNVTSSTGGTYGYKYTGGNDGHGNVEQPIGAQIQITCNCIADPRYQFIGQCVSISNDPHSELSAVVNSTRQATITDLNNVAESDAEWSIAVTDTGVSPSCTIPCDPKVTNDPNR